MEIVIMGGRGRFALVWVCWVQELISQVLKVNGGMARIKYASIELGRFDEL